jgi:hypothetical protein
MLEVSAALEVFALPGVFARLGVFATLVVFAVMFAATAQDVAPIEESAMADRRLRRSFVAQSPQRFAPSCPATTNNE